MLFEVGRGSNTVHNRKEAGSVKRRQDAMPGTTVKIYALPAIRQKRTGFCLTIGRNNDQKGVL